MGEFIFTIIFGIVYGIIGFMFIISLVEILNHNFKYDDDYRKSSYIVSCFLGIIFLTMSGVIYFYF